VLRNKNVSHKVYVVSVIHSVQLKAELAQRIYKPLKLHINKLYYMGFFLSQDCSPQWMVSLLHSKQYHCLFCSAQSYYILKKLFVIEWGNTKYLRNDTNRIKTKVLRQNLFQCHFVHHKSHTGLQLNSDLWRDRWATTLGMAQPSWKQNPS
jgi:hypothetical protein